MEKSLKLSNKVLYAKVISPHGVKGFVKIELLTDFDNQFYIGKNVNLVNLYTKRNYEFVIEKLTFSKKTNLVKFKNIEDRNKAAKLAGLFFVKDLCDIEKINDDSKFYMFELIGLEVIESDIIVGKINEIICDKESEYYMMISTGNNEKLVPIKKDFIQKIDMDEKKVILKNLEGFFEYED